MTLHSRKVARRTFLIRKYASLNREVRVTKSRGKKVRRPFRCDVTTVATPKYNLQGCKYDLFYICQPFLHYFLYTLFLKYFLYVFLVPRCRWAKSYFLNASLFRKATKTARLLNHSF